MAWEDYRNFGYSEVDYSTNSIRVYSDRIRYTTLPSPMPHCVVESATWQGNNLLIRTRDNHGNPKTFIQHSLYEYYPIH
jgi:hypothetical protein